MGVLNNFLPLKAGILDIFLYLTTAQVGAV